MQVTECYHGGCTYKLLLLTHAYLPTYVIEEKENCSYNLLLIDFCSFNFSSLSM